MSAKQKRVRETGSRRGNIYDRVEAARKKRAEVLGDPMPPSETPAPPQDVREPEIVAGPEVAPRAIETEPSEKAVEKPEAVSTTTLSATRNLPVLAAHKNLPVIKPPVEQTQLPAKVHKRGPSLHVVAAFAIVALLTIAYLIRPTGPDAPMVRMTLPPLETPEPTLPETASLDAPPDVTRTPVSVEIVSVEPDTPSADTTPPDPIPAASPAAVEPETTVPTAIPTVAASPAPRATPNVAASPDSNPVSDTPVNAFPDSGPVILPFAATRPPKPRPVTEPVTRSLDDDLEFLSIENELPTPLAEEISPDFRVALHVPSAMQAASLADLQGDIEALGVDVTTPRRFNFSVNSTQVRYFHISDRSSAEALADAIGADVRDFTEFNPPPPEGFVELWIEGRGRPTGRQRPRGNSLRDELRLLQRNIQNALRSATR